MTAARVRQGRLIVVGAGEIGRRVAARLGESWSVTFVDPNPPPDEEVASETAIVRGDGTSRLVLERAGAQDADILLAVTDDDRSNLEAARLARDTFRVRRVVVALRDQTLASEAEALGVEPIDVQSMVVGTILGRIEPTIRPAVSIGLGQGEIVEVSVLGSSAVIGRPLRHLGAKEWLVAAVYRQERLLVPHGDTRLEAGDRVVLVGAPNALPAIAEFFRSGSSAFPLPYGRRLAVVAPGSIGAEILGEVEQLRATTYASGVDIFGPRRKGPAFEHLWHETSRENALDEALAFPGVGCVVLRGEPLPWSRRLGLRSSLLRSALDRATVPILVARGSSPYRRILLAAHDYGSTRAAAEVAVGLAALWKAELVGVTASPPAFVAGPRAVAEQLDALAETDQLARVHGVNFTEDHLSGNPIRQLVARANAEADLLVVGYRPGRRHLPFSTDVPFEVVARARCSTLAIPSLPAR